MGDSASREIQNKMKSKLSKYLLRIGFTLGVLYSVNVVRGQEDDFKGKIFDLTVEYSVKGKSLDEKVMEFIEKCRIGFINARNAGEYSKATHFYLEPALNAVNDFDRANSLYNNFSKQEQQEIERQSELEKKLEIDSEFDKISLSLDDALKIYNNFDINKINPSDYGLGTKTGEEKEIAGVFKRGCKYMGLILYYSEKLGVDEKTSFRIATTENRFYEEDGDAGEKGIYQILPSTGKILVKAYKNESPYPNKNYDHGATNVFYGITYIRDVKKPDPQSTYEVYNGSHDKPSDNSKKKNALYNYGYCEKFDFLLPKYKKFVIKQLGNNSSNNLAKEIRTDMNAGQSK